jgi:hypothetical protein
VNPTRNVEQLTWELLDQTLSPADQVQLAELVQGSAEQRERYFDAILLHALLESRQEIDKQAIPDATFEASVSSLLDVPRANPVTAAGDGSACSGGVAPVRSLSRFTWSAVATACLILWIAAALVRFPAGEPHPTDSEYVGVISKTSGVVWREDSSLQHVPARLQAGQILSLEAGVVELTLNSGCACVVKGPAAVEVVSPMCVRTLQGTVRARVSEEARGFVIETPTTRIVDLGTEFGVQVDSQGSTTDVVVFEGVVDLHPGKGFAETPSTATPYDGQIKRLIAGEALRVGPSGRSRRIIAIHSDEYPLAAIPWQRPQPSPLIRGISDNIRDPRAAKYYQISRGGLDDDCRAYVDRLHEWNGIDASGIPLFLRGADYVMCFNDDKWQENLEITIDVGAPARLFVFYDERLPIPGWLSGRFELTDSKIGMDEGFPSGHPAPARTDFGAAKSIDTVYSIWRCDVYASGQIRLGSLPKQSQEVSMYGIAAIPLPMDEYARAKLPPFREAAATTDLPP